MRLLRSTWSRIPLQQYRIADSSGIHCRRWYAAPATSSEDGWETVIGLEIHAQIKTPLKLFSRALTSYAGEPNTNVGLLDAAVPGSLPVPDRDAVRLALMTALALKCDINPRSTFDRKHYFYHDIPSSYQITQHYNPLARNGRLPIREGEGGSKRTFDVGIQQLQIEQDTAKSQVVGDDRLVDLNRAGTGLMEIVTEPDMRSPEEAGAFIKRLQALLRRIGSGDGDMEKGNLRIDANVSVNRPGEKAGTRSEIKNLNSIRFMQQAIRSERGRHIAHYLSNPNVPLERETRGVNEATGETYSLRSKEDAMDYRYMPDPNLPALLLDQDYLAKLREQVPELPWETIDRMCSTYGVQQRDLETLVNLDDMGGEGLRYFDRVVGQNEELGKIALNWITQVVLGQLTKSGKEWTPTVFPAALMREMVQAISENKITNETGKTIVQHVVESDDPPHTLSDVLMTLKISTRAVSTRDIRRICIDTLGNLSPREQAQRDRSGNIPIGMLIGKVMARTKGQASPLEVRKVLEELLGIDD